MLYYTNIFYNCIMNISINKIKNNNILYINSINKLKNNSFISTKRKNEFINKFIHMWKIKYKNTYIYLFLDKQNINSWIKELHKILERIQIMRIYAKNKKDLYIYIYPSEYKKIISNNNEITIDNINSGSSTTYLYSNVNGIICLWRKEELKKVLIHEIIHAFHLDRIHPNHNEAYTELRALLYNIYFELYERNLPITKQNINILLEYEKYFSFLQSNKVLKCKNNNTNIYDYIVYKNKLLNKFVKDKYVINNNIYNIVPTKSLRFTITDLLLDNNMLNILHN